MKKYISHFFLFVTLFLSKILFAQEEFVEPPSKLLSKFPFKQLTGGVVLLQAQFADYPDTLNFLLDTGSGGISLDSMTADYFKVQKIPSNRTIRGIAGMRTVSFIYNQKLRLPNLTIDSLNFHINDYQILTAVYGEQIDGIIGFSVLSRYIIKLNYDSSRVEFWSKGRLKYPRGGYLLKPLIATLPVQTVRIRDTKTINARFLYDIGAGLCMMLSTDFIRDSAFLGKKRKFFTKEAEGLGGSIDMQMTVIQEVKLGPYKFRKVPVYIFVDTFNVTSYPYLGGLIGNDLLRRFNVILNYDKRDIYLMPNSHFNEQFDYSYSGMELYMINGIIVVGDVAKNSPAEAAGLKEGDVVIGVNKNFTQNLAAYKIAMQTPGERVKMVIRRNDVLMEIQFKVKSIL